MFSGQTCCNSIIQFLYVLCWEVLSQVSQEQRQGPKGQVYIYLIKFKIVSGRDSRSLGQRVA